MLATTPGAAQAQILTEEGMVAFRAGDVPQARMLLLEATRLDPHNEQAWLWLSGVYETPGERRECLEQVLAINPENRFAAAGLKKLGPAVASSPAAPAVPVSAPIAAPILTPPTLPLETSTPAVADEPAQAATSVVGGVWKVPTPEVDPAFDRDRFLLRQKRLALAAKYAVWDESNRAILYVERPLHLLRNFVAVSAGIGAGSILLVISIVMVAIAESAVFAIVFGLPALALSLAAGLVLGTMLSQKRHVTFYRDETKQERLLDIVQDKKFWLINATYTVLSASGERLASFRKNYLYDLFRRRWYCYAPDGTLLCTAKEDSIVRSILRRVLRNLPYVGALGLLLRTNFVIQRWEQGDVLGIFNRKLTIFDRYVLDMSADRHATLDRRIAVALGVMLDTGERR